MLSIVLNIEDAPPSYRDKWIRRLVRLGEGKYSRHRKWHVQKWLRTEDGGRQNNRQNLCNVLCRMMNVCAFTVLQRESKSKKSEATQPCSSLKTGKAGRTLENRNESCGSVLWDTSPPMLFWSSQTSANLIIGLCEFYRNQFHKEFVCQWSNIQEILQKTRSQGHRGS